MSSNPTGDFKIFTFSKFFKTYFEVKYCKIWKFFYWWKYFSHNVILKSTLILSHNTLNVKSQWSKLTAVLVKIPIMLSPFLFIKDWYIPFSSGWFSGWLRSTTWMSRSRGWCLSECLHRKGWWPPSWTASGTGSRKTEIHKVTLQH